MCDKVVHLQKPVGEMDGEAARILPKKSLRDWQDFKTKGLILEKERWWAQAAVLHGTLHRCWGKYILAAFVER